MIMSSGWQQTSNGFNVNINWATCATIKKRPLLLKHNFVRIVDESSDYMEGGTWGGLYACTKFINGEGNSFAYIEANGYKTRKEMRDAVMKYFDNALWGHDMAYQAYYEDHI